MHRELVTNIKNRSYINRFFRYFFFFFLCFSEQYFFKNIILVFILYQMIWRIFVGKKLFLFVIVGLRVEVKLF